MFKYKIFIYLAIRRGPVKRILEGILDVGLEPTKEGQDGLLAPGTP